MGYQLVGLISKYQGEWKPPAGYTLYVTKNKSKYGHHPFIMPKNEVHTRIEQLQPRAPGVGQHMDERKKKQKYFGHSAHTVIQVRQTQRCTLGLQA